MQLNPRIAVNLLVMLVKILVNLLVELTKLGLGGHRGRGLPGVDELEVLGVYLVASWGLAQGPKGCQL